MCATYAKQLPKKKHILVATHISTRTGAEMRLIESFQAAPNLLPNHGKSPLPRAQAHNYGEISGDQWCDPILQDSGILFLATLSCIKYWEEGSMCIHKHINTSMHTCTYTNQTGADKCIHVHMPFKIDGLFVGRSTDSIGNHHHHHHHHHHHVHSYLYLYV